MRASGSWHIAFLFASQINIIQIIPHTISTRLICKFFVMLCDREQIIFDFKNLTNSVHQKL